MKTKSTQTATRNVKRSSQTERIIDVIKNDIRPTSQFRTDEGIERTISTFESLLDENRGKKFPELLTMMVIC